MRWSVVGFALLVCVLGMLYGIGRITFSALGLTETQRLKTNISQEVRFWTESIQRDGPEVAHESLMAKSESLSTLEGHLLVHAFGEALFNVFGLGGLPHCGKGEFLYGCYHQIMGLATAQYGPGIFPQLKKICDTAGEYSMTCTHGLGHGLVGMYGHDTTALERSLSDCESLFDKEHAQMCADGVFMEYNLRGITSGSGAKNNRPFLRTQAFDLCTGAPEEFRDQCVFELPLWWYYALSERENSDTVFREIGSLCRGAPATASSTVCFVGIGFPVSIAAPSDLAAADVLCDAAASTMDEKSLCLNGANICFYQEPVRTFLNEQLL